MSNYVDIFIKDHKEYFLRNKSIIESNKWNETESTKDTVSELSKNLQKLQSKKTKEKEGKDAEKELREYINNSSKTKKALFDQENKLTTSILGRLSDFINEAEGDRALQKTQDFIDFTVDIIKIHLDKARDYLQYNRDVLTKEDLTSEEVEYNDYEIVFQDDVFNKKMDIQNKLSSLNITNSVENFKLKLFKDQKSSLLMREPLILKNQDVKLITEKIPVDWGYTESIELLKNMKTSDIPTYNHKKHFYEQDLSTLQFWQAETVKITKGVTINGYWVHPWLYWHINIFKTPIPQPDGTEPTINPYLRDNEVFFCENLIRAEVAKNKGLLFYGTRRFTKSVILASYAQWKAFTKFNSVATITGGSEGDLTDLTSKIKASMDYMPPALRLEYIKQEWDGGDTLLGLKEDASNPIKYSTIRVRNLAAGAKTSTQKLAGGAPSAFVNDEIGKYDFLKGYLAALPSFETPFGFKCVPLLAGCVCAGTKVWDNSGNLVDIEDLNMSQGILGYNIRDKELSKEDISYWQESYKKPCFRITTNTGRTLECSDDHPILFRSRDEKEGHRDSRIRKVYFKETKDLKVGEQIAIIEEVNVFGNKEMFHPRLIGLLIGDGSYRIDGTPKMNSCDYEINEYIYSNFDCSFESGYETKDGRDYKQTRVKGITKELRELGIFGQVKDKKTLPIDVHSYRKEDIVELLGGFFDADGTVACSEKNNTVSLSSGHKSILLEVQLLLQKLGIHGGIHFNKPNFKNPKDKNGHYKLTIADKRSVNAFYNNIQFLVGYKQENLKKAVENLKNKKEQIPREAKGLRFERVTALEYIGEQFVFNLTADNTNTYIANGIVTHNTAGESSLSDDAMTVLTNPQKYNLISMDWDRLSEWVDPEAISWKPRNFSLFVPAQMAYKDGFVKLQKKLGDFLKIKDAEELNKNIIQVTDWKGNLDKIVAWRKEAEGDSLLLQQRTVQYPISPEECFLSNEINPFPYEEAKLHREHLMETGKWDSRRKLVRGEDGKITAEISTANLVEYPFQGGNMDAPYLIIEEPDQENSPRFYYVASGDFYKQEKTSTTDSVGTVSIYKYPLFGDESGKKLVASYAARPKTYKEFNDNVFLLLEYYHASMFPENEDLGVFQTYLENKHLENEYLEKHIDFNSALQYTETDARKYGFTPKQSKNKLIAMYANYLNETIHKKNDYGESVSIKRVQTIDDIWLLSEIINYSESGNFDRISGNIGGIGFIHFLEKNYLYPKGTHRKRRDGDEEERPIQERKMQMYTPRKRSMYTNRRR